MAASIEISKGGTIGDTVLAGSTIVTADNRISLDKVALAGDATDIPVTLNVDQSEMVALVMVATVDMTVETNSSSAPDDTIALKANEPVVWHTDSVHSNPITADITGNIYLTNDSPSEAGTFSLEVLQDPTP